MNLNVVLRHELHALINRASSDQLFTALHSPQSPIRDRFIRFLALSYADWLSTQNEIDDDDIKKEWKHALKLQPPKGFGFNNFADAVSGADNGNNGPSASDNSSPSKPSSENRSANHGDAAADNGDSHATQGGDAKPYAKKQLTQTTPMVGFKRLYSDNDEVIKKQLTKIITNDVHFQALQSSISSPTANDALEHDGADMNGALNGDDGSDESPVIQKYFNMLSTDQQQLLKSKLPLLADVVPMDKRNEVLMVKLSLCATTFDFLTTNPLELRGIEKKKQMLTEMLEYIARYSWYNESILACCIRTISANLFRALPCPHNASERMYSEEEPFEDPAWSHLQLIYDLTLRLVINTDVDKKTMKKYLEGSFVDNIILLFCSEDPREREYLKTILHRIYGRFMPLRALIRSSIAHCCYNAIYGATSNFGGGTPSTNGIAEFLEIFCSIIHGFSIPVKAEHKDFLRNVLVPLHKCRKLDKFHEQLVACCVQFVFKDNEVAPVILGGLIKFWPRQSPTKEEMFIAEVVNVVNAMINHKNGFSYKENSEICVAVIDQLVKCMQSKHHSVAERALLVWGEDAIEILIDLDKQVIWPKIVGAFLENKQHWNESLRECNEEAMDVFKVRDPQTFAQIKETYERQQKQQQQQQQGSTSGGGSGSGGKAGAAALVAQSRVSKWKMASEKK